MLRAIKLPILAASAALALLLAPALATPAHAAKLSAADKAIAEASRVCAKHGSTLHVVSSAEWGTQYECLFLSKPLLLTERQQASLAGGCYTVQGNNAWFEYSAATGDYNGHFFCFHE